MEIVNEHEYSDEQLKELKDTIADLLKENGEHTVDDIVISAEHQGGMLKYNIRGGVPPMLNICGINTAIGDCAAIVFEEAAQEKMLVIKIRKVSSLEIHLYVPLFENLDMMSGLKFKR